MIQKKGIQRTPIKIVEQVNGGWMQKISARTFQDYGPPMARKLGPSSPAMNSGSGDFLA